MNTVQGPALARRAWEPSSSGSYRAAEILGREVRVGRTYITLSAEMAASLRVAVRGGQ
jgi:hypothetical protein